jgi:four helix bundle protein
VSGRAEAVDDDATRIESYRDLRVWQEAMALAVACYHLTQGFPKEEMFGLTSQIRRSAASIAANIAEGYGREHTRSFVQFLRLAQGSLKELETHLLLSERVVAVAANGASGILSKCEIVGKMLRSLIRSLQRREVGA